MSLPKCPTMCLSTQRKVPENIVVRMVVNIVAIKWPYHIIFGGEESGGLSLRFLSFVWSK